MPDRGTIYDLHVHTNCSDGGKSPGEVVRLAIENGLNTIAITDHYTLAGIDYAKEIAGKSLNVIPGIEISAQCPKGKRLHIIGLFVNKSIYSLVDYYETKRKVLIEETIVKLRANNYRIKMNDVVTYCRDRSSIGRYDIAITLASMHYASTAKKAYEEILMSRKIFIEREKLSAEEVIDSIIKANGVPILAHPNSFGSGSIPVFEERLEKLKEFGLVGMEVYTPYITDGKREELLKLCEKYELLPSVGSDFHRLKPDSPVIGLGIDNNMCITDPYILRNLKKERNKICKSNHD